MEDLSPQSKADVRTRLRRAPGPSPEQAAIASREIGARLESLVPARRGLAVMAFLPLPDEPDLTALLERWMLASVRIALPAIDWPARRMWPAEVGDLSADTVAGRHGVREPRPGMPPVPLEDIGVVLIPGVAFDFFGGRLGRGGGFYDRFLSRPGLAAQKIGVAFDQQVVGRLPREAHDVAMDAVVTDQRVIRPSESGPR